MKKSNALHISNKIYEEMLKYRNILSDVLNRLGMSHSHLPFIIHELSIVLAVFR